MIRSARSAVLFAAILPFVSLSIPLRADGQNVQQYLRDQYRGKMFVLRGFQANDVLRYDSSGLSSNPNSGDWTTDGFVQVSDIHLSDDRLIIKAQRMAVIWSDTKQFELRPLGRAKDKGKKAIRVEISADPGMHNPSAEQVDAVLARIFLTAQDSLAGLVPDYWEPCIRGGTKGADKNCVFAPEVLAIPGVAGSAANDSAENSAMSNAPELIRHVTKGMSPPRAAFSPEPAFSDWAREAKYEGVTTLRLVVTEQGLPAHIQIVSPLGYGLDTKAVEAVQRWRFKPAEKDGQPVAVSIMVEVNFHLY
jgi:TonB family protein